MKNSAHLPEPVAEEPSPRSRPSRRAFLGASLSTGAVLAAPTVHASQEKQAVKGRPTLVGSANALRGMQLAYPRLVAGEEPLDVAIDVVKVQEADPNDTSVGLGGYPNEDGVVQLDSAVMHGPTHNSGAVASIENILHPCEVARLVMERTDHCLIVGPGAYEFARMHGFPHTDLLTDSSREVWLRWKESLSDKDDRLAPPRKKDGEKQGRFYMHEGEKVAEADFFGAKRPTGTIHCSALARSCTMPASTAASSPCE